MEKIRKFLAPEFVFGKGSLAFCAQHIKNWNAERIFLVTDPGVWDAGWSQQILKQLKEENFQVVLFKDITSNPKDFEVHKGHQLYSQHNCDVIVAVGGGSVIDAAKAIGILVSNNGSIHDYEGIDQINQPMPPLLCIPTTCGTSADVSQFCIISNTTLKKKIAIISKSVVPDLSLIDPDTLGTIDQELLVNTSLDALTHAIEAYVSLASSFITDIHAKSAISLVYEYLPKALKDFDDQCKEKLMQASLEAGLAFSNASLGLVHSMAHALGGLKDFPHGECNGILLRNVCEYNYSSAKERYNSGINGRG
jgi:alcohol dehydrogenase